MNEWMPLSAIDAIRGEVLSALKARKGPTLVSSILIAILWLYHASMESSSEQATLGKIVLDLKVTDLHGDRLSFARASARFFAMALTLLTFGLGYVLSALSRRGQALHDRVSGCLVVVTAADHGASSKPADRRPQDGGARSEKAAAPLSAGAGPA